MLRLGAIVVSELAEPLLSALLSEAHEPLLTSLELGAEALIA